MQTFEHLARGGGGCCASSMDVPHCLHVHIRASCVGFFKWTPSFSFLRTFSRQSSPLIHQKFSHTCWLTSHLFWTGRVQQVLLLVIQNHPCSKKNLRLPETTFAGGSKDSKKVIFASRTTYGHVNRYTEKSASYLWKGNHCWKTVYVCNGRCVTRGEEKFYDFLFVCVWGVMKNVFANAWW